MSTRDWERDVTLTGGCLCGAVRFSYVGPLGGELGAVTVCRCSQCRRAQGFASAVAPALRAGYALEQGADLVEEYASSPGKRRAFCRACGSSLYSRHDDTPEAIRLRLGAFDAPPDLEVDANIFSEATPAWSWSEAAPRFPGKEPGRD